MDNDRERLAKDLLADISAMNVAIIRETRKSINLCLAITACLDLCTLLLVYWMVS